MKLDRLFVDLPPDKVRVLLFAFARRLDGGFTAAEAEQFCTDLAAPESEDGVLLETKVLLGGENLPFIIDVLGHDTDTFELVLIVPRVLANLVQEEIRVHFGAVPLRIISGEFTESE